MSDPSYSCLSNGNTNTPIMTTSSTTASMEELNDLISVNNSTSNDDDGGSNSNIPKIPKRPTIIRIIDKQNNVPDENTDESKAKKVPKVPPRPPPPRPGPPPVPSKQPVVQKISKDDRKKQRPEITVVSARPMSEICFRDQTPEIPLPPRPPKLKDQGEVTPPQINNHHTSVALSTGTPKPKQSTATADVCRKSSTLPPQRPRLPPASISKKDPPKIPPQRPAPLKLTLSTPPKVPPPSRPPGGVQADNSPSQPPLDNAPSILPPKHSTSQTDKLVTPPKPRPRTFIESSSKPSKVVVPQRPASTSRPPRNGTPPQPLPRKQGSSSLVESEGLKTCGVEEPAAEITPPPKPSRHQSFRNSSPVVTGSLPQSQQTSSNPRTEPDSTDKRDSVPSVTKNPQPTSEKEQPPTPDSTETPQSFSLVNKSSGTTQTVPCALPPKKNSVLVSKTFESSFQENAPVPCPRVKRSSKPDIPASINLNSQPEFIPAETPASTPIDPDFVFITSEEPNDFILPSASDILAPNPSVNNPTIIKASNYIEKPQEPKPTQVSNILALDSDKKQLNSLNSSGTIPSEEAVETFLSPNLENKKLPKPPPPIPKKDPISSNVCDRNVQNDVSSKTVSPPQIPSKDPKASPVAQMPVKNNKPSLVKEPEAKVDGGGKLIKNFLFSKKSSSSADLKKPPTAKSRKAVDMLQTTKDYTRRITQSLGFTAAEEPTSVWYTDRDEGDCDDKETAPSNKKKENNPSIWYVDPVCEEEADSKKAPSTCSQKSTKKPDKPPPVSKDGISCQPAEPSPTEISAFQKYHSYMKRTIEEAVGIQLSKSSSSLIDENIQEEKDTDIMKPEPLIPTAPKPAKQRPPRPQKPVVKPSVPAVPPKRPPAPASAKPESPNVRSPPPRPKPVVSVKPTVAGNQNVTSDSDSDPKIEARTPSIENLIGKFEAELCKKSVAPPRPAQPVNKPKPATDNLTNIQHQEPLSNDKEPVRSVAAKEDITTTPSNTGDESKIEPDENKNLSVSSDEVEESRGEKDECRLTNSFVESSIDKNANEDVDDEPKTTMQETNNLAVVAKETSEEEEEEEAKPNHKVGYSDSFNERCKSLMDDLTTHFKNNEEKVDNDKIDEGIEPETQILNQQDTNTEETQDSGVKSEEPAEIETDEKSEPTTSQGNSSDLASIKPNSTEIPKQKDQDKISGELDLEIDSDLKSNPLSQEVTELNQEETNFQETALKDSPRCSNSSEVFGPRAIANFDFDAQEDDELILKKDDIVQLLSWVDPSWLYGNCKGKAGIFPLSFVNIIEPLPRSPTDTNGNQANIPDICTKQEIDNNPLKDLNNDSQQNSTQGLDYSHQSPLDIGLGSALEVTSKTETTGILSIQESSGPIIKAKRDSEEEEEEELTDSDHFGKINIPVGGEETIAFALYDFEGEDGELSFKEGDEIAILKWVNEEWLLGKKEGMVGNLPVNYIHFMGNSTDEVDPDAEGPPEPKGAPPPLQPDVKTDQLLTYVAAQLEHVKRLKGFACARFDFQARDEDELSFKDGDRIEILEFVNKDWIRGSLHKKEGIFPAAFVSIEEFSPDEETQAPETCKVHALHDFIGSADDELSFKAGAIITCHGEVPSLQGWSQGSFEGKTGMFPTNFVMQKDI